VRIDLGYGKERPVCQKHEEACWQRNRRVHIMARAQPH
jgi:outer membrane protein OmpA-like peptidoglycan-associated protein